MANDGSRGVQETDLHVTGDVVADPVVQDDPVGRNLRGPIPAHGPEAGQGCVPGLEHVERLVVDGVPHGVERRQVVQDPEGPSLGGHHQVLPVHPEVGDGGSGEVQLQGLPVGPLVEGDEHPELGAGVQEPLPVRVLPHHAHRVIRRDAVPAVGEEAPPGTVAIGEEDVGPEVVVPILVDGHDGPPGAVGAQVDGVHGPFRGHEGRRDVRPGVSPVPGDVDPAVVAADPELCGIVGRLTQDEDGVVDLHPRVVVLQGSPGEALLFRVVGGEVGRDGFPAHPAVGGAVHELGGVVDHARVVAGDEDGGVPLEAIAEVPGGDAVGHLWVENHVAALPGLQVRSVDLPDVVAGPDDVGRVGMGVHGDVAALGASHAEPVLLGREVPLQP